MIFSRSLTGWLLAGGLLALSACGPSEEAAPEGEVAATDDGVDTQAPAIAAQAENETIAAGDEAAADAEDLPQGTPLEDRVATLGLLNKRNNVTVDIELKPGEQTQVDNVIVKLATCERRPPWDPEPETGAFVQVSIRDAGRDDDAPFQQIFSGWLFKNSPSLNVVEHPIYDVWVKDCAMTFPGEEEPSISE
ncbi:DUF2155 domain-containing protein [Croceicoccus mobilis]|uniref:DUF2155 domain-containing protein n=1 Tax=Croceicoccus mobilis TaxID=1703339 RepID=A0A916Z0Y0_9SPHN|nr:DUF2155 domain-containing protein [Croceicoccus mobilis]GGD70601.1 hypothetical protein GCM10010990_20180 [Croceicoccus mobilis]